MVVSVWVYGAIASECVVHYAGQYWWHVVHWYCIHLIAIGSSGALGRAAPTWVSRQVYHTVHSERSYDYCSPRTGIFVLSEANVRKLPTVTDDITHETIHPSVLRQKHSISSNPALLCNLLPLEEELQKKWSYIEGKHDLNHQVNGVVHTRSVSWSFGSATQADRVGTHSDRDVPETQVTTSQTTGYDTSLFGSLRHMLGPLAQLWIASLCYCYFMDSNYVNLIIYIPWFSIWILSLSARAVHVSCYGCK